MLKSDNLNANLNFEMMMYQWCCSSYWVMDLKSDSWNAKSDSWNAKVRQLKCQSQTAEMPKSESLNPKVRQLKCKVELWTEDVAPKGWWMKPSLHLTSLTPASNNSPLHCISAVWLLLYIYDFELCCAFNNSLLHCISAVWLLTFAIYITLSYDVTVMESLKRNFCFGQQQKLYEVKKWQQKLYEVKKWQKLYEVKKWQHS